VRRALALNAGSGLVALLSSYAMIFAGNPEEALVQAERATALNPLEPGFFLYLTATGYGHLLSGRPEQAAEFARRSTGLYADWDSTYWLMIPACTQLGRMAEAGKALDKLLALSPGLTVTSLGKSLPFRDPSSLAIILEGCRQAGMPE
jgi:adenylate cyclase